MLKEVIIHCRASGIPPPTITWNLNGVNIQHNEIKHKDYKNGTLKIKRVMPTDEGNLQCLAGNAAGLDTATSSIIVVGRIKIRGSHPEVFCKKEFYKISHLCRNLFFSKAAGVAYNFIIKETPTLAENTFFNKHLRWLLVKNFLSSKKKSQEMFIKKEVLAQGFPENFATPLRITFSSKPLGDCFCLFYFLICHFLRHT